MRNWLKAMVGAGCLAALVSIGQPASAGVIAWTDWTSALPGTPGTATGTLLAPGGPVTVSYAGELAFAQTAGGINYWVPDTPYLSSTVSNAPPDSDILALNNGDPALVNTLTFSAPVLNPIMALVSVGQPGFEVSYFFNSPFNVLSFGPGYWGGPGTLTELAGNQLVGDEGHGAIQFVGTYTSISWTTDPDEYWHGFQVGVEAVPEPGTLLLLGSGISALVARRRRRSS